jgi:hypothetical protein
MGPARTGGPSEPGYSGARVPAEGHAAVREKKLLIGSRLREGKLGGVGAPSGWELEVTF